MGPCSVSTRSQSKPTDAISSATSGSPKFRRLPKHAFPARSRCFTWLGVIGRQYSSGENRRVGRRAAAPNPPPPPPGSYATPCAPAHRPPNGPPHFRARDLLRRLPPGSPPAPLGG